MSLRGFGAKAFRIEITDLGGISAGDVVVRALSAYKHLGTLVTSTARPTQDAARRTNLATIAYSKVSGHFVSSKQFDLRLKLQATGLFVDATLLQCSVLWSPLLAEGIATCIEAHSN